MDTHTVRRYISPGRIATMDYDVYREHTHMLTITGPMCDRGDMRDTLTFMCEQWLWNEIRDTGDLCTLLLTLPKKWDCTLVRLSAEG